MEVMSVEFVADGSGLLVALCKRSFCSDISSKRSGPMLTVRV